MTKTKIAGLVTAGITVACVAFVLVLFLIKILWGWTVPDLFPGAVEQGLVAESISWSTAAKVAIIIGVISGTAGGHYSRSKE